MARSLKVNFILPFGCSRPIGGLRVVYEYANHLAARGDTVSVIHPRLMRTVEPPRKMYHRLRAALSDLYRETVRPKQVSWQKIRPDVRLLYVPSLDSKYIPDADAVFATAWQTADWVARYPTSKGSKFYIVQDFEPFIASLEVLQATWRLPLKKITISQWLHDKVTQVESNADNAINIPIAIDFSVFRLTADIRSRSNRIAMLYSSGPNKDSATGLAAIQKCKELFPDIEVVFFGASSRLRPKAIPEWISYRFNVSERELVEIYNTSRIFICSSFAEGFALPPAEAMACGCAVVSTDCGGNREYALANVNALVSDPGDSEALAKNIQLLLADDALRIELAQRGHEMIQRFDWKTSTDKLHDFLVSNANSQSDLREA